MFDSTIEFKKFIEAQSSKKEGIATVVRVRFTFERFDDEVTIESIEIYGDGTGYANLFPIIECLDPSIIEEIEATAQEKAFESAKESKRELQGVA